MLTVNQATKIYRKGNESFPALDHLSIRVEQGDFVSIVGPSGSGKSTLLHTIGGLIRPDSGEILYKGRDIYRQKSRYAVEYRKKHVGFVFQQFHLVPYLTVFENIKMVCSDKSTIGQIGGYLEKCGIASLRNKYPSELSVGEKQRSAFVRAIIGKPDILLADEPTGNLDPTNSGILLSLIRDFHKEGGTVLLVSHDPETAGYAGKSIMLQSGRLIHP